MTDLLEAAHTIANCLVQSAENGMHDKDEYLRARLTLKAGVPQSQLPKSLRVCPSGEAVDAYLRRIATGSGSWGERRNAANEEMQALFEFIEFGCGALNVIASPSDLADMGAVHAAKTWEKISGRVTDDPEGAVTLASKLLEDVCIAIIEASGTKPKGQSLKKLYDECAQHLGLKAKEYEDSNVQALIGSIAQVALRIGSLRNSSSDSHGTRVGSYRPASRHAKLAVNASGATAVFLLETAKARGFIST
jgi:hypothetical protein